MDPLHTAKASDLSDLQCYQPTREDLYRHEEMDILALNQFVKPFYQPRPSPIAMVVGYSCVREAQILREFHADSYGFEHGTLKVVGCNIGFRPSAGSTDSLDKLYMGHYEGDAKESFNWYRAFTDLGVTDRFCYDLAYIRNPDLLDIRDWGAVFARAIEMT